MNLSLRNLALTITLAPIVSQCAEWKPITPEELSATVPKVEKEADAEAIFWDVRVHDNVRSAPYADHHLEHYIRVKIFTDRGVKEHSTVHIPYTSLRKQSILDVRGRTIKPDGTIVELKKDAIFDKTDVKVGRRTLFKTRSFTLPDVTPGSIVEYQWSELFTEYLPRYNKLQFQREFPIQRVTYTVRPLIHNYFNWSMHSYPFNCNPPEWKPAPGNDGNNGFVIMSLNNIPAFVDEPDTPSDDETKQWLLLYYSEEELKEPKKYWIKLGKQLNAEFEKHVKVSGEVKALADEAIAGTQTNDEKLIRIADFCRTKIKNVDYSAAGITAEEKSAFKRKELITSSDTAKSRIGSSEDINYLFAAMAKAQGFEVRGVRASSHYSALLRVAMMDPYLLNNEFVAVKQGEGWKYFDVGNPYIPSGMVNWHAEGVPALLLDGKEPTLFTTPQSKPEANITTRKANLVLQEDGSLTGHVDITVQGLAATRLKSILEDQSDAKRKEELESTIRETHGDVELSNIEVENVTDPLKPLVYRYNIIVRNYADKTGRRLFFQPAFFQHGRAARFVSKERKHAVIFRHPFEEVEDIQITLPQGYSLEKGEGVGPMAIGEIAKYDPRLAVTKDGRKLIASRRLTWGMKGEMYYPRDAYPQLKAAWDQIHQRDSHTLALKAD